MFTARRTEGCCTNRAARRTDPIAFATVLLSDRDIRAQLDSGRLQIEPFEPGLVQPSSVDVRLDGLFRVFNNTRYTHIDPAQRQDDLTTLVERADGEPFVLHPGEFVLGSTLEVCTLPDDLFSGALSLPQTCIAPGADSGYTGDMLVVEGVLQAAG